MTVGAVHLSKFSLRKEQIPQLAILDTFRSGVTAALQQAKNNEEVWLEVLGPCVRNPEMYPGGPKGCLTGSFSSRTQGVIFQSSAILDGWNSRRIKSFWYSLMGVDRTTYQSNLKLIMDVEALRRCSTAEISRVTKAWLIISGCLDKDIVNGRWDILYPLFDNTIVLGPDEMRVLKLFRRVAIKTEACSMFCVEGSIPETFEEVFKIIKSRNWFTSIIKNTSFTINSRGLQALNTGKWIRQINRGK